MRKSIEKPSLTNAQSELLAYFSRSSTSSQRLVQRSKIILELAEDKPKRQIAREMNVDKKTVQKWAKRWNEAAPQLLTAETEGVDIKEYRKLIVETLNDAPRSGSPLVFTPEQIVQVVAIACEVIDDSAKPVSRWTHKEIAAEAVKRGIVNSISPGSVCRFLKRSSGKAS